MTTLYQGYEFQKRFYCKDCQQMKCTIGRLVCDDCNEIRKLAHEDRIQDDIEREAEEAKDHRETMQSIISEFYPY